MRNINIILVALVIASGVGCASQSERSNSAYPDAYRIALTDFPGDQTVEAATIDQFTQFLMTLGQPGAAATAVSYTHLTLPTTPYV